jgi:hypothetical protein
MIEGDWLHRMVRTRGHLVVVACSIVHYVWALDLWFDPTRCLWAKAWPPIGVCGVTPLSELTRIGGILPCLLVVAAILALVPVMRRCTVPMVVLCFLPQQAILFLAAATAVRAMQAGTFADGVVRTPEFLSADQVWPVVMAGMHLIALLWCVLEARTASTSVPPEL